MRDNGRESREVGYALFQEWYSFAASCWISIGSSSWRASQSEKMFLWLWKFCMSHMAQFVCLEATLSGMLGHGFRPYLFRCGGATFWFSRHGNFDKLLQQGRRAAACTARICLNEGLALMAETKVPNRSRLPFLVLQNAKFQPTLARPPKRRPGDVKTEG